MYIEQGKKYVCIKELSNEFIVGKEYLAITNHQLLNEFAVPFGVGDCDDTTFNLYFKSKEYMTPKKQLEDAQAELSEKLLPLIEEFEEKTGFRIENIKMNRATILSNDSHTITRKWLDINVGLQ